jgi:hypothetical protein
MAVNLSVNQGAIKGGTNSLAMFRNVFVSVREFFHVSPAWPAWASMLLDLARLGIL